MTTYVPHCLRCKHFCTLRNKKFSCKAFPVEIPDDIICGEFKHTQKHPSQKTILFSKRREINDFHIDLDSCKWRINLDLSFLIEGISNTIKNRENYSSYILKNMQALKENENDVELFPITDIEIVDEDNEITFISSELNEDPNKNFEPFLLLELFDKLKSIPSEYNEFEIFSGSSVFKLGDEFNCRKDTPLAAYGFDDEEKTFVLVQCCLE